MKGFAAPDLSTSSVNMLRSSFEKQCQDLFWDLYMPRGDCVVKDVFILRCGHPIDWTLLVQQMSGTETALHLAFLAFSASRLGRANNDDRMVQESRKIYGRALRDLQSALWDSRRMYSEETLLACMLLGQYEVSYPVNLPNLFLTFRQMFEASGRKSGGWISHSEGAARLVELRGISRFTDARSNALFCGTRIRIVVAAVLQRKSTFLSTTSWRTKPWLEQGLTKTWADRLFDTMTTLPSILEHYDLVDRGSTSAKTQLQRQKHMQELIEMCLETNEALQDWFTRTRTDAKPQIFTVAPPTGDYPFTYRYQFKNHLFAQALTTYWTSCLILHCVIRDVNALLGSVEHRDCELYGNVDSKRWLVDDADEGKKSLAALEPLMNPRQHALCIAQSIEYFLQPDMGALGASYAGFPTGMSYNFFRGTLDPGCRFRWRKYRDDGPITLEKDLSKDDMKIVIWYHKSFDQMKRRGLPLGDFLSTTTY